MLDDLIHRPRRQQLAALALMAALGALRASRGILAPFRRDPRPIDARRRRRIPRAAIQPALQLGDPLILARNPRAQRLDLHPQSVVLLRERQQHRDHGITTLLIDRLGLTPLHTPEFDKTESCPPTN